VTRAPRKLPGIENRERHRRDGWIYWVFRVRWTDPTSGARRSEEFDDQQDAVDFRAALRLARRRGVVSEFDRGRVTLAAFVEQEWWPKYAGRNLAKNTLRSYAVVWNLHLLPRIGYLELRRITAPVVQQLREDLEDADCGMCSGSGLIAQKDGPARECHACRGRGTLGAPTVRRALAILQSICRYAVARGEMEHNVVKDVEKPIVARQLAIVAISPAQVEALRAELDPESAVLVELIAFEGLRPEEVLALEDRHLGRGAILVEQKNVQGAIVIGLKRRRRGRARDDRSPELFGPVRQDLAEYRLAAARKPMSDGRQLLLPRQDGEPWRDSDYRNWRRRVFKPAVERAGLPITRPYDLRHACASLLIHAGWPLTEVADHLGHTVATLSQDYAHVIKDMKGRRPVPVEEAIAVARAERLRRLG
jgi:integrase